MQLYFPLERANEVVLSIGIEGMVGVVAGDTWYMMHSEGFEWRHQQAAIHVH